MVSSVADEMEHVFSSRAGIPRRLVDEGARFREAVVHRPDHFGIRQRFSPQTGVEARCKILELL